MRERQQDDSLRDPALTALLRDTVPEAREDAHRTARIMRSVTRCARAEETLADSSLQSLLQQSYAGDPALEAAPGRTERIMRAVRQHAVDTGQDLADPQLSSLLRASFADDPALAEVPGRTQHVMRRILPVAGRWVWPSWAFMGWATGSAMAVAAVLLMMLGANPALGPVAKAPIPSATPVIPAPVKPVTQPVAPVTPVAVVASTPVALKAVPAPAKHIIAHLPAPATVPAPRVRDHHRTPKAPEQRHPAPPQLADSANPVRIAATLYTTGRAAHVIGDYETAYEAYQASYDTLPTPEALLATSQVMEEIAQQTIASNGEWL